MNVKDFLHTPRDPVRDPPRRAISRAPAEHNVTAMLFGCVATAAVLAVLWALYAYG